MFYFGYRLNLSDVLGLLAKKKGEKVIIKRGATFQTFAWPLKVGRKWNIVYTLEKPQEETSTNIDLQVVVTKLEEVTVPTGTFKAFKIEVRYSYTDDLMSEWWTSCAPTVVSPTDPNRQQPSVAKSVAGPTFKAQKPE